MRDTARSYDEIIYPGNPVPQSHPDRLAAVASLAGMQPAPPARCRVLDIGCGIGGNLMAMAYQWPESTFVGIDISPRSIEIGTANIAELGLANVTLTCRDIMQTGDEELGEFDYIVAHGVYSWVPDAVRERLLAICRGHLAPQGVAYVSYNTYPGSHLRDVARDLMLYHTRAVAGARERIGEAHAILRFAAELRAGDELHARILRGQLERVERTAEEVLYHDDLDPAAQPFLLHEVVAAAKQQDLQYLGDATLGLGETFGLPPEVAGLVAQIPPESAMEREQYLDFFAGRDFRRTLLCRADVRLDRRAARAALTAGAFAGRLSLQDGGDPEGEVTFKAANGSVIACADPLGKIALLALGTRWPQSVAFADLFAVAREHAGVADADPAPQAAALADLLYRAVVDRQMEFHVAPPPLTTEISERPEASLLARRQIESGPVVSNLRHARVVLNDPVARRFLVLVDGTRTADDLVRDLNAQLTATGGSDGAPPVVVSREQVDENLRILARLALLIR